MPTGDQLHNWVMLTGKRGGRYRLSKSGKKVYGAPPKGRQPKAGTPKAAAKAAKVPKTRANAPKHLPAKTEKPHELKGVTTTKTGKKMYEGVNTAIIDKVAHFKDHPSGLTKIIYRNDGGRPVYKYDSKALEARSRRKFAKAQQMSKDLPKLRSAVDKDLRSTDPKARADATVAKLIDSHYIRVGGSAAEKTTGSSGASTLRAKHIKPQEDGSVRIQFKGKSGVAWDVHVTDPVVASNLRRFAAGKGPGDRIFPTNAHSVNRYLGSKVPGVTAKDFRTYHAGRLASSKLKALPPAKTKKEAELNVKAVVQAVAKRLGHTPAVCKKSYINPHVIESYLEKWQ